MPDKDNGPASAGKPAFDCRRAWWFDNVPDLDNFGILLGAYWSDFDVEESATDRYGARVRFKYYF
ncbi:carbohydrate porin [Zobellella sp. An-6]|uniref:carbohydrate porin n=1 Tax=Zobellella sp. An-6 TaxID=3400218 RepID=UPI004041216A